MIYAINGCDDADYETNYGKKRLGAEFPIHPSPAEKPEDDGYCDVPSHPENTESGPPPLHIASNCRRKNNRIYRIKSRDRLALKLSLQQKAPEFFSGAFLS